MKIKILSIVIILMLSGCRDDKKAENQIDDKTQRVEISTKKNTKETFKKIDKNIVKKLNDTISSKNLKTEEEIMNAYKPKDSYTEGNYTYTISKNDLGNDSQEIILVEDDLLDDSLLAKKTIMIVKKENSILKVVSIKENYKCRQNRGHQEWSAELCN
ncbi:hypothetical protein ACFQ3R_02815 [Mesonia ostreae]|uniref:Lipoprotein n=1 Tax=Mesonia ostreae TaxID=861110 RepID=A0ABU2KL06_9FLAO|nr:hypothetical protein [Mesonia ostreae]MDT0295412.1 hypothetical protein [Mesonia ostreae]